MPVAPAAPVIAWLTGEPADDMPGRIAARRSFVHVKRCFMAAVERVDGRRGQWLQHQVRHANEAIDLWLLRGAVFDALSPRGPGETHALRTELQRALESVMPGATEEEDALLRAF
jgi:hypothetical protein